jgi:hypothetical protein
MFLIIKYLGKWYPGRGMGELKDNKTIEINLLDKGEGEPEPGCFSSLREFRYRVWEFCVRWKYIICC